MNIFALPGPQFLVFYVLFAAAIVAAVYWARHAGESRPGPQPDLRDPYLLACLRGGPAEVLRVTMLDLLDRGLLQEAAKGTLVMRQSADGGNTPLERAVLESFRNPARLAAVFKDTTARRHAGDYEDQLRDAGLIPDDATKSRRIRYLSAALLALLGVAGVKLCIALGAGRTNVGFLITLMVVAAVASWKIGNPYRTTRGDSALADMRGMFADLRRRVSSIQPGGGTREALWLTALFGVGVLPASAFPFARQFRPDDSSGGGGGCGSSGGCGGGGGGGCGGCGS